MQSLLATTGTNCLLEQLSAFIPNEFINRLVPPNRGRGRRSPWSSAQLYRSLLVGGGFTTLAGKTRKYLARLHPNGSLDNAFNPGADTNVFGVGIQADGKILVAGKFTTLGRQRRKRIGRLTSGAAWQSLAIDASGTTATWSRSGAGPEIGHVTFEQSVDGTNYVSLGSAARVSGGWQLEGLSLPAGETFLLRARGNAVSDRGNGSRGIIESVAQFYRMPSP